MYSNAEIRAFAEKDLRISKLAITKSLIEKSEDIYDVEKVTELAEKYIDYVYEERRSTKRGNAGCVASSAKHKTNWEQIAIGLNLAIPNATNIKMLNLLLDEHKKAYKASANPSDILVHILETFGRYPAKTESVSKVVQSFIER